MSNQNYLDKSFSKQLFQYEQYLKEMWVDIGMNDINDQQVIHKTDIYRSPYRFKRVHITDFNH